MYHEEFQPIVQHNTHKITNYILPENSTLVIFRNKTLSDNLPSNIDKLLLECSHDDGI